MATALTPISVKRSALTPLGSPAAGDPTGNTFQNSGQTLLYLANGSTERTLGVSVARKVDGQSVTARSFTVASNFTGFLAIGSVADYGSTVTVTPSHAELTVKVIHLES